MTALQRVLTAPEALQLATNRPGDDDGPGLMAFLVVAALAVACVIIYRSLRRHLGKINFEETPPPNRSSPGSAGSEPS